METHHHAATCRKKKGVVSRFNPPWVPSDETIVKQRKKLVDKVLSYIVTITDLSAVTLSKTLEECGVTAEQYEGLYII